MAKKRVYEIAKERGVSSAELLDALREAGVEVKAAASSVEESTAEEVLSSKGSGDGKAAKSPGKTVKAKATGKRRRVVIDAQASRRQKEYPAPQTLKKGKRKRRRSHPVVQDEAKEVVEEEAKEEQEIIEVKSGSTVKDVAASLGIPVSDVIKKLMQLGEMASITQTLSDDAIRSLAEELGKRVEVAHVADESGVEDQYEDSDEDLEGRPPVVVVMGHVDHGKTSLLDAIRETEVVAGEAGGITQHIGAYQVHHGDKVVTFLDTPGHEAFTAMRARGAKITDVAVIVVAADDGVKPQTVEAIDHAKAAGVPMLVAVNKIDKEAANPKKVRTELSSMDLSPEDWGGETVYCDVSAKTKQGLEDLLDMIILVSEVEELKANPDAPASGTVIESRLDPGRGAVATVLIERGTLRVGDAVVAGPHWAKVRAMSDYVGQRIEEAEPGAPVEILGFNSVPAAGEHAKVVDNERQARSDTEELAVRLKAEELGRKSTRVSLEDLFKQVKEGAIKKLNLVVKVDVAGSLEVLEDEIAKAPQEEVSLNVIHQGVGGVNESDVMLAAASSGIVLAFNVRPTTEAKSAAAHEGVEIRSYSVIYELIDELKAAMEGMLEPEEVHMDLGVAEVRQVFRSSKVGAIAGCYVTEGKINRNAKVRVVRDGTIVQEGSLDSLKRFKDDVRDVESGMECGLVVKGFADVKEGDLIEAYETKKVERKLT